MLGSIIELWRYPVKSMQGEALTACQLVPGGVIGDRSWAIVDPARGYPVSAKQAPVLMTLRASFVTQPTAEAVGHVAIENEDGQYRFDSRDPEVNQQLSAFFKHPLALEKSQGRGFFDDAPLHLVTRQTLERLAFLSDQTEPGAQFDRRRFRANVVVDAVADDGPWPEQRWSFRKLTMGEMGFTVRSGTERCAMITMPFADLPGDPSILKTTMQSTRGIVGVYLSADAEGCVSVGDPITRAW
ncbi:MAG: MOSC domain-containing protein [Cellvibrionales bacterium]